MRSKKISLILNIIIIILVLVGSIFMFTGFKFMPSKTLLASSKIEMFKYFTVDSNILIGIISLIYIIFRGKISSKILCILKLVGTSSVSLTFIITLFFLTPQYGFYTMYNNSNLFFHLLVPICAITSYVFFEENKINYEEAFYGVMPMLMYGVFYISNILLNLDNDGITFSYDFYGFLGGNINNIYIVVPVIFCITYMISLLLIFFNKKVNGVEHEK